MKYLILFVLAVTALDIKAGSNAMKTDPVTVLNEARAWSSYEEVIVLYKSLSPSNGAAYGIEQQMAVSSGLRSAERVFESLVREGRDVRSTEALRSVVTTNRSIVDIALIGVMVSLGETAKYPSDTLAEQLRETYKVKEMAEDVVRERRETLKAVDVLLKLKAAAAPKQGNQ